MAVMCIVAMLDFWVVWSIMKLVLTNLISIGTYLVSVLVSFPIKSVG